MNLIRRRCITILVLCIFIFGLLIFKIYTVAILGNKETISAFHSQNSSVENTSNLNFNILDYSGKQLLKYKLQYYVVINPYVFLKNNSDTNMYNLRALTYTLKNYNSSYDLFSSSIQKGDEKLYWQVDEETYDKINKIKGVNGVYSYIYYRASNDEAADICSILTNFKNNEGKNKDSSSLESIIQNETKSNPYPEKVFTNDMNGNLTGIEDKKIYGSRNIELTIDKEMTDKVSSILNSSEFQKYKQIGVLIMESNTGKIRVMTQKDNYKGNINAGIQDGYLYPGSIFKTVVEEAALESKTISKNDIFQDDGRYSETGKKANYNLTDAYVVSANEVFMKIGNKTGFNNIFKYAKEQGLFDKVLGLNYEQYGKLKVDPLSTGDLSLLSIGQNFRITPLEAISIPNTVINGGIYVKPTILEAYVDENDKVISTSEVEKKRILDENTANFIKNQMNKVVESASGTGKLAYVAGSDVGGKTGTSTRVENDTDKHVDAWFAGYFKIGDKYYSTIILVPNISDNEEAGNTAAPILKKIVEILNK